MTSDTWLQPDVSFLRFAQIQSSDPDREIASDSNTASQLDLKAELYFANGSSEVWVVYPRTQKVIVHLADGDSKTVAGELNEA